MLFHVSIEADDPRLVAEVLAEIWAGKALPFPPVPGSWAAFADDARGSMIEVYPRGTEMHEGPGEEGALSVPGAARRHGATHIAIATTLDGEAILDIACNRGWSAKYCRRGGRFGVVELWIEGCFMVEVLTADMQREYLDTVSIAGWRKMLDDFALSKAA